MSCDSVISVETDEVVSVDDGPSVVEVITAGPQGPAGTGGGGGTGYLHTQTASGSVWTITHNLGYDPGGIVVIDSDGYMRDGFGVQYLTSGVSLRLSFDIGLTGTARLS